MPDNQSIANYSYDLNGRLVSDVHDGVTLIKWSKSDKVLEVHKPNGVLTIKYNALDQKVSQSTSRNDSIVTEYFVYDPSGNVLATYGDTIFTTNGNHRFSLHQLSIYGSSRIGLLEVDSLLWKDGSSNIATVSGAPIYSQKLGLKRYELSNHLGNVQTVVTDRKLVDSHSSGQITAWKADVISVSDYYAFGMKIEEKTWSSDSYRFGFNGKDFFSDWNRQDYGFRIYDPRKCRFESVDPLHGEYPWNSTYAFAENDVIRSIDLDGSEKDAKFGIELIRPDATDTKFNPNIYLDPNVVAPTPPKQTPFLTKLNEEFGPVLDVFTYAPGAIGRGAFILRSAISASDEIFNPKIVYPNTNLQYSSTKARADQTHSKINARAPYQITVAVADIEGKDGTKIRVVALNGSALKDPNIKQQVLKLIIPNKEFLIDADYLVYGENKNTGKIKQLATHAEDNVKGFAKQQEARILQLDTDKPACLDCHTNNQKQGINSDSGYNNKRTKAREETTGKIYITGVPKQPKKN